MMNVSLATTVAVRVVRLEDATRRKPLMDDLC